METDFDRKAGVAMQPKVSVCMPASRNTPWFRQALFSVVAQSLSVIEILNTDDNGRYLEAVVDGLGDPIVGTPRIRRVWALPEIIASVWIWPPD